MSPPQRYVFLDRDGVINRAVRDGYVLEPNQIEILPHAAEGIAQLNRAGYKVLVVSNQQCVGKGLLDRKMLDAISRRIEKGIAPAGATIERFYYCPHLASDHCNCRKPKPGLFFQAERDYGIDLEMSAFVGDTASDMVAGAEAGLTTIFVATGLDPMEKVLDNGFPYPPDLIASSLLEVAKWLSG